MSQSPTQTDHHIIQRLLAAAGSGAPAEGGEVVATDYDWTAPCRFSPAELARLDQFAQAAARGISDALGELANMVAGVAKTTLAERGVKTFISIPRAVIGAGHYVHRPKNVQCVEIKFESDMGTVVLDLAIRVVAGVSASVSNA